VEYYDPWYGMGVLRVEFDERLKVLAVRWVHIRDYLLRASPSQRAPDSKRGPDVVSQVSLTPCFFQRWDSIPDSSSLR
jgi:hypothetical protein